MLNLLFNSLPPQIVLQEVPNEISLQFTITGCQLNCDGCHSPEIHDPTFGEPLTPDRFLHYLDRYKNYISCVLFFGGEWQKDELITLLSLSKQYQLKTCLYTGKDKLPQQLLAQLDYVKYGLWKEELGGLDSKTTNQRFIDNTSGNLLNHLFLN